MTTSIPCPRCKEGKQKIYRRQHMILRSCTHCDWGWPKRPRRKKVEFRQLEVGPVGCLYPGFRRTPERHNLVDDFRLPPEFSHMVTMMGHNGEGW